MATKRYKRKSYKKRSFKKRSYKRKSFGKKADGGYLEKITTAHAFVTASSGGSANFTCNWLTTGVNSNIESYFSELQFQQCAVMFKDYKITSMKIEYIPNVIFNGSTPMVMSTILCGTAMDSILPFPINSRAYIAALDAKVYPQDKPFKRFYRFGSYSKAKNVGWRTTAQALGTGYPDLPNCQTCLQLGSTGLAAGISIGALRVTYYVRFRYRSSV